MATGFAAWQPHARMAPHFPVHLPNALQIKEDLMLLARSALIALFCCTGVAAQELAEFTALSACRIDDGHVRLSATFDGSGCQAVEPVDQAEPRGTIIAVTIPTSSTAEICTMQIVPIETVQVIKADLDIADLDVTAIDPQNNPVAHGVVMVEEGAQDCVAPTS
jgi:hypothetical protein